MGNRKVMFVLEYIFQEFGIIQADLILHKFILYNFALTPLENLHHFSNVCNNFHFSAVSHWLSMATQLNFMRLAESDVTVTPISHLCGLITLVI